MAKKPPVKKPGKAAPKAKVSKPTERTLSPSTKAKLERANRSTTAHQTSKALVIPAGQSLIQQNASSMGEHQQKIMALYGGGLPFDLERIIDKGISHFTRGAEEMLEGGKCVLIIKECVPHGDFHRIVTERMGLDYDIAYRFARTAAKFCSPKLQGKIDSLHALGRSKLYELVFLDDEELVGLAEGGTVAGMAIDDIDRMGCRELRKALRDAKSNTEATHALLGETNERLAEEKTKTRALKTLSVDDTLQKMRKEILEISNNLELTMRVTLRDACTQYVEYASKEGLYVNDYEPFLVTLFRLLNDALHTTPMSLNIELDAGLPTESANLLNRQ